MFKNKKLIIYSAVACIISACAATVKCIQTGVFVLRTFGLAASFAILAFGSWKNGKK